MARLKVAGAALLSALLGCQREKPVVAAAETAPPRATAAAERPSLPAPAGPPTAPAGTGAPPTDAAPSARLLLNLPTPAPVLQPFGPSVVQGRGVVTSVEPQATKVGLQILEAGGNAVDAAVAVAFALAVTHPSAGNIGGGGFLLLRLGNVVEAIDFREDAPRKLSNEAFEALIAEHALTPAAVGIPGTVAGLFLAHERRGRLPWKTLLSGAISLAREGALMGPRQSRTIGWAKEKLRRNRAARATFLPQGRTPTAGTRLKQPGLALALERIAQDGPRGFYQGPTAADLLRSLGPSGLITSEELASYTAVVRDPLFLDYHGTRVVTMPPPSGGGLALLSMLSMLDRLRVAETSPGSAARYHLHAEVSRRAQVERQLMVAAPGVETAAVELEQRKRWTNADTWLSPHPIDPKHKTDSGTLDPRFAEILAESEHTTHFSVVDAEGGVVSCTVTLSASFGTGIVSDETGIVLNNAVGSFAKVGKNVARPGVRTISSMAPTLVLVGEKDVLVLGSPGGDTIPSTIAGLVVALVDDRLPLDVAVGAPRIFQGFVPDEISTERSHPLPLAVVRELERLGHRVRPSRTAIGDANIAAYFAGRAGGVNDGREGGEASALERSPPP